MKQTELYKKLRPYQKTAVQFALTKKGVGLFADPRTGKTWITLAVIEQLDIATVLAVVPKTNKLTTWVKWVKNLLPQYGLYLSWDEYKKSKAPYRILITHYEELPEIIKRIEKHKWGMVVLDESQRIKARNSRQSRHLRRLRNADRRIALSGTPMDKNEIDLWGQMRFIEPTALGTVWKDFDKEFLKPAGFMGYKREFRSELKNRFQKIIEPYCLRIARDETGIKEPKVYWTPVVLLGKQRQIYEEMEQEWLVGLNETTIKSELEITKRVKLQQITGGFLLDEDGQVHHCGEAKLRKVKWLLDKKLTPPVIIFCGYLSEVERVRLLCEKLSTKVKVLTGAIKDTKKVLHRSDLIEDFQQGKIDYLICQQKTGGVGIDLYTARNAIFYSFNSSWIDFDQAKSRMDVLGQDPPTIYILYAENTIDSDKMQAILSKRSLTTTILDRLRL